MTIDFSTLPRIAGHRGAKGTAPENTLPSFRRAAEIGVRFIEFDANLAGEGEIVSFHDYTLERCTDGTGNLSDHSLSDLALLDAGEKFSPEFRGTHIPTLREVIEVLSALKMGANLEIKSRKGLERETVIGVARDLKEHWPSDLPLLLSSFSEVVMSLLLEYLPDVSRGWLVEAVPNDWQEKLRAFEAASFHCEDEPLTAAHVKAATDAGYPVLVYTVNERDRAHELLKWGVSSVISDFPERMMDLDRN
ncbi:MAG: glycerophosphoryl diester phosphodiesterase [Pseudomonadota bacterium]